MKISRQFSALLILLCCSIQFGLAEQTTEQTKSKQSVVKKQQKVVTINSKVKGSQEQPNVLYVMPWQGVKSVIHVDNQSMHIVMPELTPIYPKKFQQQVREFHQRNTIQKTQDIKPELTNKH